MVIIKTFFLFVFCLVNLSLVACRQQGQEVKHEELLPREKGNVRKEDLWSQLIFHFDPSKIEEPTDGSTIVWQSAFSTFVDPAVNGNPELERLENGLSLASLKGGENPDYFSVNALFDGEKDITIFSISKRFQSDQSYPSNQRLLSLAAKDSLDSQKPSFHLAAKRHDAGAPNVIEIHAQSFKGVVGEGKFLIGAKAKQISQDAYEGGIGEILIFEGLLNEADWFRIGDYIKQKWKGYELSRVPGWTKIEEETDPLVHTHNPNLPFTDPENLGDWQKNNLVWDEFDTESVDFNKWWDHDPFWYGRAPGCYVSTCVEAGDGNLKVWMIERPELEERDLLKQTGSEIYHTYASGALVSKKLVNYGYYEIRARSMNAKASSAWWFAGSAKDKQGRTYKSEIDAFEFASQHEWYFTRVSTNLHIFEKDGEKVSIAHEKQWYAPFLHSEDFHIYGLEWGPDTIKYYVDGELIRTEQNTDWHIPMQMHFDSEVWEWVGMPEAKNIKRPFLVDYVRAWTRDDWGPREDYIPVHFPDRATNITKYARSLDESATGLPRYQKGTVKKKISEVLNKRFNEEGLLLWLDATNSYSLSDNGKRIYDIKNQAESQLGLLVHGNVQRSCDIKNGTHFLRLRDESFLTVDLDKDKKDALSVFAVVRNRNTKGEAVSGAGMLSIASAEDHHDVLSGKNLQAQQKQSPKIISLSLEDLEANYLSIGANVYFHQNGSADNLFPSWNHSNMDWGEVLIFARKLNGEESKVITSYLTQKWNTDPDVLYLSKIDRQYSHTEKLPVKEGLSIWLDASDVRQYKRSKEGKVVALKDRSGKNNDAFFYGEVNYIDSPNSSLGYLKLGQQSVCCIDDRKGLPKPVHVFVVAKRDNDMTAFKKKSWARLFSITPLGANDLKRGSGMMLSPDMGKKMQSFQPTLFVEHRQSVDGGIIGIGAEIFDFDQTATINENIKWVTSRQHSICEIGEIICFDRKLSEQEEELLREYLTSKWGL